MPSLLVMVGTGKLDDAFTAQWLEQLDIMRLEALPMIAVSPSPTPSVLLDIQKCPELHSVLQALRTADKANRASIVCWCALIASDLSVVDTYLLVNVIRPLPCRIILRFHLLAHHSTLARIDQVRQLMLCTNSPEESVLLDLDVSDLGAQLAQVQAYQAELASQRGG